MRNIIGSFIYIAFILKQINCDNDQRCTSNLNIKPDIGDIVDLIYLRYSVPMMSIGENDYNNINLNNCGLKETHFKNISFLDVPLIPIYLNLDNNSIRLIEEKTFSSFFRNGTDNYISIANNPLDCDQQTQFKWIFDRKNELIHRILNATCSDGTSLWDSNKICKHIINPSENTKINNAQTNSSCICKENVFGVYCDKCKHNAYYMDESNLLGCTECFCFGITDQCTSSSLITTQLLSMDDRWRMCELIFTENHMQTYFIDNEIAKLDYSDGIVTVDQIADTKNYILYFSTPVKYLGNKVTSYGGYLKYIILNYVVKPEYGTRLIATDLVLIGQNITIFLVHSEYPLFGEPFEIKVKLVEQNFRHLNGQEVTREQIMMVLVKLEAIYIRGTYFEPITRFYIQNVLMDNTGTENSRESNDQRLALSVENCNCPTNYKGTSCEECAAGYYRNLTGPYLGLCFPCQCNGHSMDCDVVTGQCLNCQNNTEGFHCEKDIKTLTKESIKLCNEDFSYNGQYLISKWPSVKPKQWSYGECLTGYVGIAKWFCGNDSKFDINGPIINCTQSWIKDLDDNISESNITSITEVIEKINLVNEELNNNDITYFQELDKLTEVTSNLQIYANKYLNASQFLNESYIIYINIINISSNLFSRPKAWEYASDEQKANITSNILLLVQYSSFGFGCQLNHTKANRIENKNIIVESFKYLNESYLFKDSNTNTAFLIPDGLYKPSSDGNMQEFCINGTSFATVYYNINRYLISNISQLGIINSNITGVRLTNDTKISPIKSNLNVKIRFKHMEDLEFGDQSKCVFWDFNDKRWKTNGCYIVDKESNRYVTTCECNHLSINAVTVDKTGRLINEIEKKEKYIYLWSGMSSICLLLTIILIKVFKKVRISIDDFEYISETITYRLCISLTFVNIYILFGMNSTNFTWLCRFWSAILLYSLISAFIWINLGAFFFFKVTRKIFPVRSYKLTDNHDIFAYCIPLIILLIAITIAWLNSKNYDFVNGEMSRRNYFELLYTEGYYFCWISSPQTHDHIWIIAYPVIIVMIINMCFIGLSLQKIYKVSKLGVTHRSYELISGFIFLWFDLLLTWIVFYLFILDIGIYFLYLFIFLNGSQGIFILIFYSIRISKIVKCLILNYNTDDSVKLLSHGSTNESEC